MTSWNPAERSPNPGRGATPTSLPAPLQRWVEGTARSFLQPPDAPRVDFARPAGEEALIPASSVSWRVFKKPVALFAGDVAAVLL